jgi:hypothetical protein
MTLKEMAPKTGPSAWKIPVFCLCLAVVLVYAKPFLAGRIFHPDPMPVISDTRSDSDITILYHERPPYYVTGPLGIYGLLTENFKFVRFSDMPGGNQRYLLFSQTTDTAIIDRVNAAIIEQRAADPADPAKYE